MKKRKGPTIILTQMLSDPTDMARPYRETGVAIPLSHCSVSCGVADYHCYTPHLSVKMAYRNPKTGLGGGIAEKASL